MPRFIATFNMPDGMDPDDVAIYLDMQLPRVYAYGPNADGSYGNHADATVWASEGDYLADLEEMVCRTGKCWRCDTEVTEQFDRIALDAAQMNTCPASEEFDMPHEIDPPE